MSAKPITSQACNTQGCSETRCGSNGSYGVEWCQVSDFLTTHDMTMYWNGVNVFHGSSAYADWSSDGGSQYWAVSIYNTETIDVTYWINYWCILKRW